MIVLKIQNDKFKVLAQCLTHRSHDSTAIVKNSLSTFLHHGRTVCMLHVQQ